MVSVLHALKMEVRPMPRSTAKTGTTWTRTQQQQLKELAKENTPTRVIGVKLQRTEDAIRSKAQDLRVSLKPTNQKPYNRRSK
jgi:hypothetical protein